MRFEVEIEILERMIYRGATVYGVPVRTSSSIRKRSGAFEVKED